MIYNQALPLADEKSTFGDEPALLRVCSLLRQECRPIYIKGINSARLSCHIPERGTELFFKATSDRNVRLQELPDSIISKLRTIDFVITFDERFFAHYDVIRGLPPCYTLIKMLEVSLSADGRRQIAITRRDTSTKIFLSSEKDFRETTEAGIWFVAQAAISADE